MLLLTTSKLALEQPVTWQVLLHNRHRHLRRYTSINYSLPDDRHSALLIIDVQHAYPYRVLNSACNKLGIGFSLLHGHTIIHIHILLHTIVFIIHIHPITHFHLSTFVIVTYDICNSHISGWNFHYTE
jgi:hypothetical protein